MNDGSKPDNAKLYQTNEARDLIPFVPGNIFQLNESGLGVRLLFSTNEDRIEMFKRIIDLFPGPFFFTVVVQESHGALNKPGRLYSDRRKTRTQVDFFLDHFHDYFSHCGLINLWVTCEVTDGIGFLLCLSKGS